MHNYCLQSIQDFWRGLCEPREQEPKSWMIRDNDVVNNDNKKKKRKWRIFL